MPVVHGSSGQPQPVQHLENLVEANLADSFNQMADMQGKLEGERSELQNRIENIDTILGTIRRIFHTIEEARQPPATTPLEGNY